MRHFLEVLALVVIVLNVYLVMQNGYLRSQIVDFHEGTPAPPGEESGSCGLTCPVRHQPRADCSGCECSEAWAGAECDIPAHCAAAIDSKEGPVCAHAGQFDAVECTCRCLAGWGGPRCEVSVAASHAALRSEFERMRDAEQATATQQTGCITCTISRTTLSPDPLMKPTPLIDLTYNSSARMYNGQEVPMEVAVYPNLGGLSWPTRYAKEYLTLRMMTVETTLPELGGMVDLAPAVAYHLESTFSAKYPDSKLTLQVAAYQLYRMVLPRNEGGAQFNFRLSPAASQFYEYLPTTFNAKDQSNLDKWLLAFQTWGTSTLIETVYGGMHARVVTTTPYFSDGEELHVELCLGGNAGSNLQCGDVDSWRKTLLSNPAIIRYRAVPLSEFAPIKVRQALQSALTYYEDDEARKQASELVSCPPSCHNGGTCSSPGFECECKADGTSTFMGTTCSTPEYHVYNSSSHDTKMTPAATTACSLQYGVSLVEGYQGGAVVYVSLCGLIVKDGYWHMVANAFNGKPYYCLAYCKPLSHISIS